MTKKGDFLSLADFSSKQIWAWLQLARDLKVERQAGENKPILHGKVLGMIFQKPSLRTRVSFEMGMKHLGGDALYLSPQEIGLGGRESVADVAARPVALCRWYHGARFCARPRRGTR